jgi:DNA-binding LytR/AlgR family response regulator
MLRVLIADDEETARRRLKRLLSAIEGIEVVAECTSGEAALLELDRTEVDAAFLDVRMGKVSGLSVAELAAELGVEIVLVTAHPDHAVDAFERGAADYVLKPVEPERLSAAALRVRQRIEASAAPRTTPIDRLAVSVRGEVRLIRPADVSHAVLDGTLVTLWAAGEALLTELSLQDLDRKLAFGPFERVHRRALLNLEHVERLKPLPTGGYLAVTREGHEVPVSRQAARGLRRRLGID